MLGGGLQLLASTASVAKHLVQVLQQGDSTLQTFKVTLPGCKCRHLAAAWWDVVGVCLHSERAPTAKLRGADLPTRGVGYFILEGLGSNREHESGTGIGRLPMTTVVDFHEISMVGRKLLVLLPVSESLQMTPPFEQWCIKMSMYLTCLSPSFDQDDVSQMVVMIETYPSNWHLSIRNWRRHRPHGWHGRLFYLSEKLLLLGLIL